MKKSKDMETRSLKDKTVMVTGATSGIGKETALSLAKLGAEVVIVARNRSKGEAVQSQIITSSGNSKVKLMLADMASLEQVRNLAESFQASYSRLDVLVNNAGMLPTARNLTVDGYEETFAVNFLAPFLLTSLLLPALKAGSPSRIVNVATMPLFMQKLDFDNLQGEKEFSSLVAYAQSKLALVIFTYALALKLLGSGVTANALFPGMVQTGMGENAGVGIELQGIAKLLSILTKPVMGRIMVTAEKGAYTSVYLASSPEVEGVNGKFFNSRHKITRTSKVSYQQATWQKLWYIAEQLTELEAKL